MKKLWRKIFGEPCKHDWEILSSDHIPPETVQIVHAKRYPSCPMIIIYKHVTIAACKKCGKIRRFITGTA